MKAETDVRTHKDFIAPLRLLLVLSGFCLPAVAGLGGDLNSVQDDAAHMKATVKVQQKETYAIHEITTKDNATVVREYVSADGRVFAVAWQGLFMPDLTQILGSYLQRYSAAVEQEHAKGPGRRPLLINQSELVVESSGRMRAYYGRAYVPDMLPQGVQPEKVR